MRSHEIIFSHLKGQSPFVKEINKLLDQASVYQSILKTPDVVLENLVTKLFYYANEYQDESAKNKLYIIFGENKNFPASIMHCAALMKKDDTYQIQKFVPDSPETKTDAHYQLQTVSLWMDVWKKFIFQSTYYPGRINKYRDIIPIEQLIKLTNPKSVADISTVDKNIVNKNTISKPIYRLFVDHEKETEEPVKDNEPTKSKLIWV